jgi:hypothetical protein
MSNIRGWTEIAGDGLTQLDRPDQSQHLLSFAGNLEIAPWSPWCALLESGALPLAF